MFPQRSYPLWPSFMMGQCSTREAKRTSQRPTAAWSRLSSQRHALNRHRSLRGCLEMPRVMLNTYEYVVPFVFLSQGVRSVCSVASAPKSKVLQSRVVHDSNGAAELQYLSRGSYEAPTCKITQVSRKQDRRKQDRMSVLRRHIFKLKRSKAARVQKQQAEACAMKKFSQLLGMP